MNLYYLDIDDSVFVIVMFDCCGCMYCYVDGMNLYVLCVVCVFDWMCGL